MLLFIYLFLFLYICFCFKKYISVIFMYYNLEQNLQMSLKILQMLQLLRTREAALEKDLDHLNITKVRVQTKKLSRCTNWKRLYHLIGWLMNRNMKIIYYVRDYSFFWAYNDERDQICLLVGFINTLFPTFFRSFTPEGGIRTSKWKGKININE